MEDGIREKLEALECDVSESMVSYCDSSIADVYESSSRATIHYPMEFPSEVAISLEVRDVLKEAGYEIMDSPSLEAVRAGVESKLEVLADIRGKIDNIAVEESTGD